jgi:hypothetical protein
MAAVCTAPYIAKYASPVGFERLGSRAADIHLSHCDQRAILMMAYQRGFFAALTSLYATKSTGNLSGL